MLEGLVSPNTALLGLELAVFSLCLQWSFLHPYLCPNFLFLWSGWIKVHHNDFKLITSLKSLFLNRALF